jgi:hypothetical protein
MKKLICLLSLCIFIFCGCEFALENQSAVVFFSARPILRDSFTESQVEDTFNKGQLIYFCVYSKTPFNANEGRIQILQKEPKAPNLGYSMYQAKDILLNPAKNYYTGCFTIYSDGFYLLRVFTLNSPKVPISQRTFWVAAE